MFSAVVFGAGRTGSHLIKHNLAHYFNSDHVIQTHNPLLKLPTENTIPVISRRASMFDAIVSMFVASKLDKFHWFSTSSKINIDPFFIDSMAFTNMFIFQTAFYQAIEARKFTNAIEIVYEELLADPKCLFSKFGHDHNIKDHLKKSPYDAESFVINLEQLKDLYLDLSAKGITAQDYDFFIKNVESDLKNIKENHQGNRHKYS
ncbi:MAG: hypothetical protein EBY22_17545 [Gammaproteobacteria bacterium]|nr:hypothetical protein [Gammaproteobacteria bacterium]